MLKNKNLRVFFGRAVTVIAFGTAIGTIAHEEISNSNGSRDIIQKCEQAPDSCSKEEWRQTAIKRHEEARAKALMAASGATILMTPLFPRGRREEDGVIKPKPNNPQTPKS